MMSGNQKSPLPKSSPEPPVVQAEGRQDTASKKVALEGKDFAAQEAALVPGPDDGLGATSDATLGAVGAMFRRADAQVEGRQHKGLGATSDATLSGVKAMMGQADRDALKADQLGGRERIAKERAARAPAPPTGKAAERERLGAEAEASRPERIARWEVELRLQQLELRAARVEPDIATQMPGDAKVLIAAAREALTSGPVGDAHARVEEAQRVFDEAFARANYKARSVVEDELRRHTTGPTLTEALRYADAPLCEVHARLQAAVAREQWSAARGLVKELDGHVAAMAPHVKFFKTFLEKREPWIRGKLGASADATLGPVLERVAGRFALDRAGLGKLRAWLDANYMGTIERPETEAEFEAVKGNDGLASAKLDELHGHGVIRSGGLAQKYRSSWDHGEDYSVEYTVQGIPQIVIHAHCSASGKPKDGNGTHWKLKGQKFAPGASHPVSATIREAFIDAAANRDASIKKES